MNNKVEEHSEFYQQYLKKFTKLIIIPLLLLILGVILFWLLRPREVSQPISGKLRISQPVTEVRLSAQDRVVHNYLQDKTVVKKGQTLIVYHPAIQRQRLQQLQQGIDFLQQKTNTIKTWSNSIEQQQNLLTDSQNSDKEAQGFYQAYNFRRQAYQLQNDFAHLTSDQTQKQIEQKLASSQKFYQQQLQETQTLEKELRKTPFIKQKEKMPVTQFYQQQLAVVISAAARKQLRQNTLGLLELQIGQLKNNVQEVKVQQQQFAYGQYNSDTNQQNREDLQAEQLKFAAALQEKINQQKTWQQQQIQAIKQKRDWAAYKAPVSGIVHLGTTKSRPPKPHLTLAQIEPLALKGPLTIQAKLAHGPAQTVKSGQTVVITLSHQLLRGKVIQKSKTHLTAQVWASTAQRRQLRSHVQGHGSVIIEQPSVWSQWSKQTK